MTTTTTIATTTRLGRLRLMIRGDVQGVGFRPYVHRLATSLGLDGFVRNTADGALVEVEGSGGALSAFVDRLGVEAPPPAYVEDVDSVSIPPCGAHGFEIVESQVRGRPTASILPDLATCPQCVAELFDPRDRRWRYPFINCTHCGPRFSIIRSIPYDRPNTSMRRFLMCPDCQTEYDDPMNRRFHAQPNACPACGPHLELWDAGGVVLAAHDGALVAACHAIRTGQVVAVKGIGGFHLVVDARNEQAVRRLRLRKHREEKPLAIMMPNVNAVAAACHEGEAHRRLLTSPAAPIVLLRKRDDARGEPIAESVAPGNPSLGVMLPYSPLHHLLMADLAFPIVATSGNLSDEPICIDEYEAVKRLADVADYFLVHNRPIVRPVDDSVARIVFDEPLLLRRSRGYAPRPIRLDFACEPVLAVGAHLKNTVALATGEQVFISQHIGDLEAPEALSAFEHAADALIGLYKAQPRHVARDLHPDYLSSQYALKRSPEAVAVQHHHAHVAACMAEHHLAGEVLGVCWDGTGYGPDGTIWGGEVLRARYDGYQRAAHLRTFALPGGSRAVREPRCSAIGMLYEVFGAGLLDLDDLPPVRAFAPAQWRTLVQMIERRLNSPLTSSAGRLFDGVAALLDLHQTIQFEGQAAMAVEIAADAEARPEPYPFELHEDAGAAQLDWGPMIRAIVADVRRREPVAQIAARFHCALIDMLLAAVQRERIGRVVLTGGCFQNVILLEGVIGRLKAAGYDVYWPRQVPPGDGGISLGQAVIVGSASRAKEQAPCV